MRKILAIALALVLLMPTVLAGCSAGDPITDHVYFTDIDVHRIAYVTPYYEEISMPSSSLTGLGIASDPAKSNSQSGLVYVFTDELAVDEKLLYFTAQMPHNYREGTDIIFVVHFHYSTDEVGTLVRWAIRYSWSNIGDNLPVGTSIWKNSDPANNDSLKNQATKFTSVSGTGKTISSQLLCYLSRNSSHVDDTYTDNARVIGVSILYQVDSPGSLNEWSK